MAGIGKEAALMPVLGMKHGVFLPLKLCLFSGEAEGVYVRRPCLCVFFHQTAAQWERPNRPTDEN